MNSQPKGRATPPAFMKGNLICHLFLYELLPHRHLSSIGERGTAGLQGAQDPLCRLAYPSSSSTSRSRGRPHSNMLCGMLKDNKTKLPHSHLAICYSCLQVVDWALHELA